MTTVHARYYNGENSTPIAAQLRWENGHLVIQLSTGSEHSFALAELRFSQRLGNTHRHIYLPDGAQCTTQDNDFIDTLSKLKGGNRVGSLVHTLESHWRLVAIFVFVLIAGSWALVQFGIPYLATRVAYALPTEADVALGRNSLDAMDRVMFSPSKLDSQTQQRLQTRFQKMVRYLNDQHPFRLELRDGGMIGPNALALPSGIIVMTDQMVQLAQDDDELAAVLAHEFGHIVHRHATRTVLQNSAVALLFATLTGDMVSISSLSATLPTLLTQAKYSREFESEADQFAIRYMHQQNIDPRHMANLFARLLKQTGADDGPSFLQSHPALTDRINLFNKEK